jgi:hypothetical protein
MRSRTLLVLGGLLLPLAGALGDIARRYGQPTAAFVALQLEYPWPAR